jgi:cytochrome P450
MFELLDEYIDQCIRNNDESFVTSYARAFRDEFDVMGLKFFLRDLMCAGTETATTAIHWTILYLANHPEWQERLRNQVSTCWSLIDDHFSKGSGIASL